MSAARPTATPLLHVNLLLVQLMFATLPIAGKFIYDADGPRLDPLGVAAARAAGGALAFFVAWCWSGNRERIRSGADFARLALFGLLGVGINQVFFLEGLERTTAVNASVLVTTIPVFTAAIVVALRREVASARKLCGIALGFVGAGVVIGLDRVDLSSATFLGNAMIVLNAFSYALYLVLARRLLAEYSSLTVTMWVFVFGAILIAPLGVPALVEQTPAFGASEWGLLAFIVAVPTIGAYLLNAWCLKRAPATLVAVYIYLQPVATAVLAFTILNERTTRQQAIGAALIFVGIWLAGRARSRP